MNIYSCPLLMAHALVGSWPTTWRPIIYTDLKRTQVLKQGYVNRSSDTPGMADQCYLAEHGKQNNEAIMKTDH